MEWFLKALRQWSDFSTRARRREFWMFVLVAAVVSVLLSIVDFVGGSVNDLTGLGTSVTIWSLLLLVPGLAVTVRRLHDIDRTGRWVLIGLVPLVGVVVLLAFACLDGTPGDNRYGANPKSTPSPSPATAT